MPTVAEIEARMAPTTVSVEEIEARMASPLVSVEALEARMAAGPSPATIEHGTDSSVGPRGPRMGVPLDAASADRLGADAARARGLETPDLDGPDMWGRADRIGDALTRIIPEAVKGAASVWEEPLGWSEESRQRLSALYNMTPEQLRSPMGPVRAVTGRTSDAGAVAIDLTFRVIASVIEGGIAGGVQMLQEMGASKSDAYRASRDAHAWVAASMGALAIPRAPRMPGAPKRGPTAEAETPAAQLAAIDALRPSRATAETPKQGGARSEPPPAPEPVAPKAGSVPNVATYEAPEYSAINEKIRRLYDQKRALENERTRAHEAAQDAAHDSTEQHRLFDERDGLRAEVDKVDEKIDGTLAERGRMKPAAEPPRRPPPPADPQDLLAFLRAAGGVIDQTGELKAMDAHLAHRGKPFVRNLVKEDGLTPDYAREAAEEAGYLKPGSGVEDLYDAIDRNLRGERVWSSADINKVLKREERIAVEETRAPEEFEPYDEPPPMTPEQAAVLDDWASAGVEDFAMRVPPKKGKAGELFDYEETAQGDQAVMPGAERISGRELAERRMEGRKGSAKTQRDVGETPLFDTGARDQGELLSVEAVEARLNMEPGERYAGFREETPGATLTEVPKEEPLRREAVLAPFMEAIGAPLYQGRVKGQRLGFYSPGLEQIRIKKAGDLETAAHEVAHAIDDRMPEIRRELWNPASNANVKYREELRAVSYDRKKLYEGWAEFMRLYMTQRETAKTVAPNVYGWVEDFFAGHEYGPAIRRAQGEMHAWYEQGALQRARSKIGTPEEINEFLAGSRSEQFTQGALDDLYGIRRMEEDLFGVVAEDGIYNTARLTRGVTGTVEAAVKFGAPKFMGKGRLTVVDAKGRPHAIFKEKRGKWRLVDNPAYEAWGLGEVLRPVMDDLEAFGLYAVGRRAEFLRSQGRENLFTPAEITAMKGLETPARKKAFEGWQVFNKQILDFAEKAGVIDPIGRRNWETDVYLPFYRATTNTGTMKAGGTPGSMKVVYRLKGGTANLADPATNMLHNTRMLIEAAVFNNARRQVVDAAMSTRGKMGSTGPRGGAHFLTKIPTESKKVTAFLQDVRQGMIDNLNRQQERGIIRSAEGMADVAEQVDMMMDQLSGPMQVLVRNQAPRGDNVIAVMRDGKPSYYEVADPLLLKAMQALPRKLGAGDPFSDVVLKYADLVRRVGQASITYTVNFVVRNALRDPIMAWTLSKNGFKPIIDSAKGLKSRVARDPYYREWMASGGAMASFWRNEASFGQNLGAFYQRAGIDYNTVLNTPRKALYFVEEAANSLEVMSRLGEMRKAIGRGKSPAFATMESREITTDFAMRGSNEAVNALYRTFMFLKAGTEGTYRTYRGFTGENRAQVAGRTAMIAGLSMALYAWNRSNPLYQELPDWDRDTAWHFFIPKPEALEEYAKTGVAPQDPRDLYHHFRSPKPWEIGMMGTIAERALEGVIDAQPAEAGKHIARAVHEMFRFPVAPQVLEPILEMAMNEDLFREAPVVSQSVERLPSWQQRMGSTSRTMAELGEMTRNMPDYLQINPAKTEHLLRGYLNGWAMYGLQMSDALFFDDAMAMRTENMPGLGAVYRPGVTYRTRQENDLYDVLNELNETRASLAFSAKSNRMDLAQEALDSEAMKNAAALGVGEAVSALREMQRVASITRTLDQLHAFIGKFENHPVLGKDFRDLRKGGNWRNLGELKREVRDVVGVHKNVIIKRWHVKAKAQGTVQ